jgi:pimeloyl-ACP methyl ester carboxylesterase
MRLRRPLSALLTAGLAGSLLATAVPGAAAGPAPEPGAPAIRWGACGSADAPADAQLPANYQCARYRVPLDHDRPRGAQLELALIRRPADDPAARQGTVFVNPGGPGGSGVDFVAYAGEGLGGPQVRTKFDLVGFDPRGIARSTPLQCYPSNAAYLEDVAGNEFQNVWPETDAEWRAAGHDALDLDRDCRRGAGPVLRHMSSADVARDLDVLRRAVGDPQLNFLGYSYGTVLCANYIGLFPQRVGALVCDAVVDPVRWTTGRSRAEGATVPTFARLDGDDGAQATLQEFFRLCDAAGPACSFGPGSARRYAALVRRLDRAPVEVPLPEFGLESVALDDQLLISVTLNGLYTSALWPIFADLFSRIEAAAAAPALTALRQPEPEPEQYLNTEGVYGVTCGDSVHPDDLRAWRAAAERPAEGYFTEVWATIDLPCLNWPAAGEDRYLGPFDKRTANPVLFVSSTYDPATPYPMAVASHRRLPGSALLTVHGWGHAGSWLSACGDAVVEQYLLTRRVPARELECSQDADPFTGLPEPLAGRLSATAGAATLAELADGSTPGRAVAAGAEAAADLLERSGRRGPALQLRARAALAAQASTG